MPDEPFRRLMQAFDSRVLLGVGLALSMAGCERESNGVEGSLPTPDTLVASVTLSIGRASGRDHEIVSRAFSGFRRANRIFVAHGAGPELRVYDLDGRLVSRAGREGSAPGEFRQLRWIAPLYPDSVLAFDGSLLRVSIFHDGSFARSFQLDVQGGQGGEWIGTHDDRIAVAVTRMADPRTLQAGQPVRDSLVIAFIPMDPEAAGQETVFAPSVGGRFWHMRKTATAFSVQAVEEGPRALVAGRAGTLVVSAGDVPEVLKWNGSSWDTISLRGLDPGTGQPAPARAVPGRLLEHLALPSDGGVWVALTGDTNGVRRWLLYGEDGIAQATLDLPAGFVIWQAEDDWMLGRRVDDAGVEFVELLALRR